MKGFNKFKKRIFIEALTKSILISISIGLITLGGLLIPSKILGQWYNILVYIFVPILMIIGVFGLVFLITYPTKKKVAKRLDKDLELKEKVQTMVEFENDDNFIIQIQREDTNNKLESIPTKHLKFRINIFVYIITILGLASAITTIVIPAKAIEPTETIETPTIDPTFNLDKWTTVKIKELIKYVKDSNVEDVVKEAYIDLLEDLIVKLEAVEKESEMKVIVSETIAKFNIQLDIFNSNNEYYTVLKAGSDTSINAIVTNINSLNVTNIFNGFDNMHVQLESNIDVVDSTTGENQYNKLVASINENITRKLEGSNLTKNDPLYEAMHGLVSGISSTLTIADKASELDKLFDNHLPIIVNEFEKQCENKSVKEYVEKELLNLFPEVEEDDVPTYEEPTETEDEPTLENQGNQGGGLGEGEELFGSNDAFFDPEKGIVEFGDVIGDYRAEIHQKFQNGEISQEYYELFESYFDELYGLDSNLDEEGEN